MALPQQGTETKKEYFYKKKIRGVNGLTPTGDGNQMKKSFRLDLVHAVLMALPQQGTETAGFAYGQADPTEVLMALPQQGTETIDAGCGDSDYIVVLMALPQQGTETSRNL